MGRACPAPGRRHRVRSRPAPMRAANPARAWVPSDRNAWPAGPMSGHVVERVARPDADEDRTAGQRDLGDDRDGDRLDVPHGCGVGVQTILEIADGQDGRRVRDPGRVLVRVASRTLASGRRRTTTTWSAPVAEPSSSTIARRWRRATPTATGRTGSGRTTRPRRAGPARAPRPPGDGRTAAAPATTSRPRMTQSSWLRIRRTSDPDEDDEGQEDERDGEGPPGPADPAIRRVHGARGARVGWVTSGIEDAGLGRRSRPLACGGTGWRHAVLVLPSSGLDPYQVPSDQAAARSGGRAASWPPSRLTR